MRGAANRSDQPRLCAHGETAPLRMGAIEYVNILPVIHFLGGVLGNRTDVQIVSGPPERLNGLLSAGQLDLGPVSSIEYARHQAEYRLVDDHCIASRGAVRSVILFSRRRLADLDGRTVSICRATATSRVLLRVLLERFVGVSPRYLEGGQASDLDTGRADAVLLIGDDALTFPMRRGAAGEPIHQHHLGLGDSEAGNGFCRGAAGEPIHQHDLGQLWWESSGLPMVFAVWAVRRDADGHPLLGQVRAGLRQSRERGLALPDSLLHVASRRTGMDAPSLRAYYQGLHFVLDESSRQGLLTFYRHASELGLCPPCERLAFVPAGDRRPGGDASSRGGRADARD